MCEGLEGALGPIWERMSRGSNCKHYSGRFCFMFYWLKQLVFIEPLNQVSQSQMNESSFMFMEVMTAIKI